MSIANPIVQSWNGIERRIYIKQGVDSFHWIDDIYIEYRNARRVDEDFRKFEPFMIASGNEAKGGGKATPRLLKLLDGVKVICFDENIEITVGGEAITDNADVDPTLYDNSTRTQPLIINYQPPAAEVIVVDSIAQGLDYNGILVFDSNNVSGTGQEHPIGTNANPVNNISDALAIANKYYLSNIELKSNLTADRNLSGFAIHGQFQDLVFDCDTYTADRCSFNHVTIQGNFMTSYVECNDCILGASVLDIYGNIKDSWLTGLIRIAPNMGLNITDSESGIAGLGSPVIDMNLGNDCTLSLRSKSGGLTVENCDTPACVATLEFTAGLPHLEPSCTDGYISVRGTATLDDRSNGTVVDKSSLADPALLNAILDIIEGDVIPTADIFQILHRETKAVLLQKNAATNLDGLTELTE